MERVRSGTSTSRVWVAAAVAAAAALPVLRILANNPGENLSVFRLAMWGAGFLVFGLLSAWLAHRFDRAGSRRLQATVIVALLVFLMYGSALGNALDISDPWLKLATSVALVIAAWLTARWSGVQQFFLILPFFLLVAPVFDLATGARPAPRGMAAAASVEFPPPPADDRPDVYWFILDGLGRADVIDAMGGGLDMVPELVEFGFQVDRGATAPFAFTHLSLATTLTAGYLPVEMEFERLEGHAWAIVEGPSNVSGWFDDAGYRQLILPGARWPGWKCGPPDSTCLVGSLVHLEDDLIQSVTLLDPLLDLATLGNSDRAAQGVDPVLAIENVLEMGALDPVADRPNFSVIHVMSTHPPYRWLGPDCTPQPSGMLQGYWLPFEDYLDAVRCTGQKTLDAVALILTHDPNAVIVIQGDHGPRIDLQDWETLRSDVSLDSVWMGVLLAAKLPDGCELNEGNSTVNVFRVVIGCVGGREMERLPARSWGIDWDRSELFPVAPDRGAN